MLSQDDRDFRSVVHLYERVCAEVRKAGSDDDRRKWRNLGTALLDVWPEANLYIKG